MPKEREEEVFLLLASLDVGWKGEWVVELESCQQSNTKYEITKRQPVLQSAEVPGKPTALFLDSKRNNQEDWLERHGFIRTYMCTGGSWLVKFNN